jgi:hypothetical protein
MKKLFWVIVLAGLFFAYREWDGIKQWAQLETGGTRVADTVTGGTVHEIQQRPQAIMEMHEAIGGGGGGGGAHAARDSVQRKLERGSD